MCVGNPYTLVPFVRAPEVETKSKTKQHTLLGNVRAPFCVKKPRTLQVTSANADGLCRSASENMHAKESWWTLSDAVRCELISTTAKCCVPLVLLRNTSV